MRTKSSSSSNRPGITFYILPRPRATPVARVLPLALPLTGLRVIVDIEAPPLVVAVLALLGVLPRPVLRTLPRVAPIFPLFDALAACPLLLSAASSAFLAVASLCCSNSCWRRSAACCFNAASSSMSTISCEAPCQLGFSIKRWLCSVCERMRVHELTRYEAESTVWEMV